MKIGILTVIVFLGDIQSLKAKRSVLSPIIARLHKAFNISVGEIDRQDVWNQGVLACVMVANDTQFLQHALENIHTYIENQWRNIDVVEYHIEIL